MRSLVSGSESCSAVMTAMMKVGVVGAVSYTHLTLPTILRV